MTSIHKLYCYGITVFAKVPFISSEFQEGKEGEKIGSFARGMSFPLRNISRSFTL
jgi:hypothetical protein